MKWVLAILLIPTVAFSADPCPDCETDVVVDDVSGGWATSLPAHKLDRSFSPNLRNVFIDNDRIEQIRGTEVVGSTPTLMRVDGFFPYVKEDGETTFLVSDSSIVLETSDFRNYVMVSSGHNVGVLMRCKQINNDMWCSNGADAVFKWDGEVKTNLDGNNGTPNVPKGKYIGFFQERVHMFNLPSDASGDRFSDVKSTNGVLIAPDNFLAWPAGNLLHVGQGDGQIGTAIWVENGRLKYGKERSIYTLFGLINPTLSNPSVGVASHDSVVMLDNQSNFVGHDGIYRNENRNSDLISDEAESINTNAVRVVQNAWETPTDFRRGQFYGTTATASGFLNLPTVKVSTPPSRTVTDGAFAGFTIPGNQQLSTSATYYGPIFVDFRGNLDNFFSVYTSSFNMRIQNNGLTCGVANEVKAVIYNRYTGFAHSAVVNVGGEGSDSVYVFNFSSQAPVFESWQVHAASYALTFELSNKDNCNVDFGDHIRLNWPQAAPINGVETVMFTFTPATTGQFISDVATNSSITTWGNFESERNTSGGAISYALRTATSVVNIATRTWASTTPGVRVNQSPTETFVQWAATLSWVTQNTDLQGIDNVTIDHVEGGGALNRAFALSWKGRYYLAVSTTVSDSVSSLILVKARITNKNPDAWMPISGINVRSFAKSGESTFYAGSSTAGIIFRLDFGSTFSGVPIRSFYETPDIFFDSVFKEKDIFEYYLIADKNPGSSFSLGLSLDGGGFSETTYSLAGSSGTLNRVIQGVKGKAKTYRWRFLHETAGDPFSIHNFAVLYKPTQVRKSRNE